MWSHIVKQNLVGWGNWTGYTGKEGANELEITPKKHLSRWDKAEKDEGGKFKDSTAFTVMPGNVCGRSSGWAPVWSLQVRWFCRRKLVFPVIHQELQRWMRGQLEALVLGRQHASAQQHVPARWRTGVDPHASSHHAEVIGSHQTLTWR